MLKIKGLLYIDSWNTTSKVVNPRNPNKVYQCNSLCRMRDKNDSNTIHVILEEIDEENVYDREKVVVELNQFMNTWNPYVEPEKEENNEVGEEVHA